MYDSNDLSSGRKVKIDPICCNTKIEDSRTFGWVDYIYGQVENFHEKGFRLRVVHS
jgi:hypothetical protein